MRDIEPVKDNYVPTSVLAKQGVTAVAGIVGGVVMFFMGALPPIAGIVVGGVVTVVGIGAMLSKDPDDKKPGRIATVAGLLTLASKVGGLTWVKALAGTALGLGAVGMFAVGVWNGIKFLKGLKKRS
ncbi:MAG: hypothetical protein LBS86_08220 [Treponema sp.]|jgi:hypothetical protein|nr:hypothetical protein [Treponema sp.]